MRPDVVARRLDDIVDDVSGTVVEPPRGPEVLLVLGDEHGAIRCATDRASLPAGKRAGHHQGAKMRDQGFFGSPPQPSRHQEQ